MQHLKNFNWKKFLLQGVLPCLLAVAVGFISRYQLELSDGVTESFLQLQWPLYAPLNALTAFCLTLILFALLGKWSRATGISGAVFTIIALINYYTRDLHGSALMPQDILNLGTAAEVMGSYTLKITQDVVKIVLLYLPILAIAFVQAQLVKGAPKRAGWKARGVRAAGSALGVFLVMFFGYFGPVTIKPKTTYGWAWQNTYYTYGYLAGTIEATSLMADPVIEPENYNDAAAVNTARKADDYTAPASPESAEDYPDIVLILSESFYDFDLKRKIEGWLKLNYCYLMGGLDVQYIHIKPRIIAEKFIENDGGDLYDYKIFCFNGEPKIILHIEDRYTDKEERMFFLDTDWNQLPFNINVPLELDADLPRPANLEKMLDIARTLSQGYTAVRVDLYSLNDGSIKFGEMTFTTESGISRWHPESANDFMGSLIHLPGVDD